MANPSGSNISPLSKEKAHNLSQHRAEVREKASALGHDVQELAHSTKNLAKETMGMLGENAQSYYQQGMQKAHQLEESLETKIRENPMRSCLIAAGIGLVIGALLKRR
jgi:ElaB/YqjD/DUF883 family membrane-anchored ribosome-binding protein